MPEVSRKRIVESAPLLFLTVRTALSPAGAWLWGSQLGFAVGAVLPPHPGTALGVPGCIAEALSRRSLADQKGRSERAVVQRFGMDGAQVALA